MSHRHGHNHYSGRDRERDREREREKDRERDREYDRRRSVDIQVEEREYHEHDRERDFRFEEFESYNQVKGSGALVPIHQERIIERDIVNVAPPPPPPERFMELEKIERIERREGSIVEHGANIEIEVEKKITEHEHEHHHRHIVIDHGTTYINAAPPPPPKPVQQAARQEVRERETTRVTLEGVRERRYGTNYKAGGSLNIAREYETKPEKRESSRGRHAEYTSRRYNYDEKDIQFTNPRLSAGALANVPSPKSSTPGISAFERQEWTVVDVPSGTRRFTTEVDGWKSNSIRRNKGGRDRQDLWTEMTKDLVTREALEEFGYFYEETDDYFYIFDFLHRDQIHDLIELSKDVRREKIREIESSERRDRGRSQPVYEHDRITDRRDFTPYGERDRHTERRDFYYAA